MNTATKKILVTDERKEKEIDYTYITSYDIDKRKKEIFFEGKEELETFRDIVMEDLGLKDIHFSWNLRKRKRGGGRYYFGKKLIEVFYTTIYYIPYGYDYQHVSKYIFENGIDIPKNYLEYVRYIILHEITHANCEIAKNFNELRDILSREEIRKFKKYHLGHDMNFCKDFLAIMKKYYTI